MKLYKYNIRKSEDGASGNLVCFRKSLWLLKKKALCIIDNNLVTRYVNLLETIGLGVKQKGEEVLGYPTLCCPTLFYCTIPCPVTAHPIPSCHASPSQPILSCPVPSMPSPNYPFYWSSHIWLFTSPSLPLSSLAFLSPYFTLISKVTVIFTLRLKYWQTRCESAQRGLYKQDRVAKESQAPSGSDCLN